jgi:hypothetical protein
VATPSLSTFRYNERHSRQAMFRTLLLRAAEPTT